MHKLTAPIAAVLVSTGLIAAPVVAASANNTTQNEQAQIPDPQKVAKQTVSKVLSLLQKHRQTYKKHPEKLYDMINEVLIPHFDMDFIARFILGGYWHKASQQQRERFIRLFKRKLIRTYGKALLRFDDEKIVYLPVRAEADATDITFRVKVVMENGKTVPVTLSMHYVNGQWKIYNGSVGNLSFLISYRGTFRPKLAAGGIDAVIERLAKKYGHGGQSDNHNEQNEDQVS